MLKATAIKHYKTAYKVAKALGVSRQYVYQWPDVVPIKCARRLEEISEGKVKVKVRLYNGAEK
jgi:hypothetical protein